MKKEVLRANRSGWSILSGSIALLVIALAIGCGDGQGSDPLQSASEDERAIDDLVSSLADVSGDINMLRERFTKEGAPSSADGRNYRKFKFMVDLSSVNVTGSTATFTVTAMSEDYSTDAEPTTKELQWKAAKEGEAWKLSEAPID